MKPKKTKQTISLDKKIRWLLVLALTAFVCFMTLLYQQKVSQEKTRNEIYDTYSLINKLELMNKLIAETEAASRGFLLTNDSTWKTSLLYEHTQLRLTLKEIEQITGDYGRQVGNTKVLKRYIEKKIEIQNGLIDTKVITRDLLNKIRNDSEPGRITRSIKSLLGEMSQVEKIQLTLRIEKNERVYNSGVVFALLGGVFAIVIILVILYQLNKDILLRKKAEEEAGLSESKYRNLIENAGVVMYTTDVLGHITFANSKVSKLTGYTAEELLGRHFSTLLDPENAKEVLDFYRKQFEQRIPTTQLEFLSRTKKGTKKWVEQSAQLVYEDNRIKGFQCMVKDITSQKMIASELSMSEQLRKENLYRLTSILDNTTALIFIKDLQGRYVMVNRRFKDLLGLTDEMILYKTDAAFASPEDAERYRQSDEAIITGEKSYVESEEVSDTKLGKKNLLSVKFPLLNEDNKIFGIGGIVTDITERVMDRQQLVKALTHAEEAKELQEQFFANMSHEIRTPLNGIQGMNNLLQQTALTDIQQDYTNMINLSLNNLLMLLNDVLDFSNLQAGKLTLTKIEFNLLDILDEVKNMYAQQVNNKELDFRIILDPTVPEYLTGDPYRLKQVLINLIGNAIKFTQKGRVHLTVSRLKSTDKDLKIAFSLEDTGIGIPNDKLDSIFKSFAQVNKEATHLYGGTGLGLAISKGLVELQGGNISVESKLGEGSTFSFAITYQFKNETQPLMGRSDFTDRLSGKSILVVEDNEINQKVIVTILRKVGAAVTVALNGKEAVALFDNQQKFDLVILDLQMPVMNGYETALYIRHELGLDIPIIAMTATALKGDQEKCKQVGMNDFMLKPFDFNDLYKRLIALLYNEAVVPIKDTKNEEVEKLYDLTLLEELDDKESLLEVLELFLQNTPIEIKELTAFADQQNWDGVFRAAHKIKGAVSILQATKLSLLLGALEANAREENDLLLVMEQVATAIEMYTVLEKQLLEKLSALQKELS